MPKARVYPVPGTVGVAPPRQLPPPTRQAHYLELLKHAQFLALFGWAAILLWPGSTVFDHPMYQFVAAVFGSRHVLGALLLVLAFGHLAAIWWRCRWLVLVLLLAKTSWWASLVLLFWWDGTLITGVASYAALTIASAVMFLDHMVRFGQEKGRRG